MSANGGVGDAAGSSSSRRPWRPKIRQASVITPRTGERVHRVFTLQNNPINESTDELQPLLGGHGRTQSGRSWTQSLWQATHQRSQRAYAFARSKTGLGILKCSLAYLLASMATFVMPIAMQLGRNDSKHMVATVTVYFHPARSAGSMQEATVLALIAFLYAAFISFSSMGVSTLFSHFGQRLLGQVIVLLVFCGGGLGLVAWTKQRLGSPLVNVACSLASLSIITVLTKEGAVQDSVFSEDKVVQILKMVLIGILSTALVSFVVRPISARRDYKHDLARTTDMLAEFLSMITRAFLSGAEEELKGPHYDRMVKDYGSAFSSLTKNLGESKWEHYLLGAEAEYHANVKVTKCVETIAQDLRGLRSAATIEFELLRSSDCTGRLRTVGSFMDTDGGAQTPLLSKSSSSVEPSSILSSIHEEPEEDDDYFTSSTPAGSQTNADRTVEDDATEPSDIFAMFINSLGPSMKSLAYTLREVLHDLPFDEDRQVNVNEHFRGSLVEANEMFTAARKQGLAQLYRNRVLTRSRSAEVAADFEEVAASCGYFSSALQDLAEHTISYVDALEELKAFNKHELRSRSWDWLKVWRLFQRGDGHKHLDDTMMHHHQSTEQGLSKVIPKPRRPRPQDPEKPHSHHSLRYRVWRAMAFFRRQDIKFAIKVGAGAVLFAMWSFIPSTRPIYSHWRLEWGLLSYMLVCSMTVGASNTTGFQRSWGTGAGACLAIVAWVVADDNPYVLAFFGWLISICCFYIIIGLGKGPLGRYILLTYNLSALYSYSLSMNDEDDDEDEGGVNPVIWEIVLHRTVAVLVGVLWGMVITRLIWPISARKKLKDGLSVLWLRMGLIWKRDPLTILVEGSPGSSYMDIRESLQLQRFLSSLHALREAADAEFDLRGAFPNKVFRRLLEATGRILDAFYSMHVVIAKDLKASPGEAAILRYTKQERMQLSSRISHLFSVLASSMKLEYPLHDDLPDIEHTRDRLLAKLFEFRTNMSGENAPIDEDYELLYAYSLVTGQLAQDIVSIGRDIEQLYGVLNEDSLKLQ